MITLIMTPVENSEVRVIEEKFLLMRRLSTSSADNTPKLPGELILKKGAKRMAVIAIRVKAPNSAVVNRRVKKNNLNIPANFMTTCTTMPKTILPANLVPEV
jgi:hypothetical protein